MPQLPELNAENQLDIFLFDIQLPIPTKNLIINEYALRFEN